MLHAGDRWVSLGRAAVMMGMAYRSMIRHLELPDHGFTVHETKDRVGKRHRYLMVREIQAAMGAPVPIPSKGVVGKTRARAPEHPLTDRTAVTTGDV
jgi:hypothetical protein